MIVAAAAADEPELLSEIVDGERAELADFHDRLLERLVDAAAQDELAARRERRSGPRRAARTTAAAAAVLALLGLSRVGTGPADNRVALATATQQYADFSSAVSTESPGAVSEAAAELHETLETLITQHAGDPEVAQQAAQLLQAEISLLQVKDPAGASQVIAQARSLMTLLRRATPPNVRASVAPILDAVQTPSPKPTSSPKPKPSATSSPKPSSTPKATSTPSASASATDDDDGPLHAP
jgi:type VI protein secretion system component VasK